MGANEEFSVRPKGEDDRMVQRLRELEEAAARRRTWRWINLGLNIGLILLTGLPIVLPGDGDGGGDMG